MAHGYYWFINSSIHPLIIGMKIYDSYSVAAEDEILAVLLTF
jgi:hypothetical protein